MESEPFTETSLDRLNVTQLRTICKGKKITGYSKIAKPLLIQKLLEHAARNDGVAPTQNVSRETTADGSNSIMKSFAPSFSQTSAGPPTQLQSRLLTPPSTQDNTDQSTSSDAHIVAPDNASFPSQCASPSDAPVKKAKASDSSSLTAGQAERKKKLEDDPLVAKVDAHSITCKACGKVIKSKLFDLYHWNRHKGRCGGITSGDTDAAGSPTPTTSDSHPTKASRPSTHDPESVPGAKNEVSGTATSSDSSSLPASQAPEGKNKPESSLTAAQESRKQKLEADPMVAAVDATSVTCKACGKTIKCKLFDSYNWNRHRTRCNGDSSGDVDTAEPPAPVAPNSHPTNSKRPSSSSFDEAPPTKKAKASHTPQTVPNTSTSSDSSLTAAQASRKQNFEADPMVAAVDASSVTCKACGKTIKCKLFDTYRWNRHKARCPGRSTGDAEAAETPVLAVLDSSPSTNVKRPSSPSSSTPVQPKKKQKILGGPGAHASSGSVVGDASYKASVSAGGAVSSVVSGGKRPEPGKANRPPAKMVENPPSSTIAHSRAAAPPSARVLSASYAGSKQPGLVIEKKPVKTVPTAVPTTTHSSSSRDTASSVREPSAGNQRSKPVSSIEKAPIQPVPTTAPNTTAALASAPSVVEPLGVKRKPASSATIVFPPSAIASSKASSVSRPNPKSTPAPKRTPAVISASSSAAATARSSSADRSSTCTSSSAVVPPSVVSTSTATKPGPLAKGKRFTPLVLNKKPQNSSTPSSIVDPKKKVADRVPVARIPRTLSSVPDITLEVNSPSSLSLYHLDFPPTTPLTLDRITMPPALSQRKQVARFAVILSQVSIQDLGRCMLVSKMFRYAVYLSASTRLAQRFSGYRLGRIVHRLPANTMNMWPYLLQREGEAKYRRRVFEESFLGRAFKGRNIIGPRLWTSPDNDKQITVALRFLMTRLFFTISVGRGKNGQGWLDGSIVDAREIVKGEIWCIDIMQPSGSSPSLESIYVLESTCEAVGLAPSPLDGDITVPVHIRADWSAYIAQKRTPLPSSSFGEGGKKQQTDSTRSSSLIPATSLLDQLSWTNHEDYSKGIAKVWLKRIEVQQGVGAAKRIVAERYILACVVGNSVSGKYMTSTEMAQDFAGLSTTGAGSGSKVTSKLSLFLPAHHHVESVHFTTPKGSPLHPALAIVQTPAREYYVLRDNGMQVGCEEEGVAAIWMMIIGCKANGQRA